MFCILRHSYISKLQVWRKYEMKHKPACVLDIRVPAGTFDVNLTPDKREIILSHGMFVSLFNIYPLWCGMVWYCVVWCSVLQCSVVWCWVFTSNFTSSFLALMKNVHLDSVCSLAVNETLNVYFLLLLQLSLIMFCFFSLSNHFFSRKRAD